MVLARLTCHTEGQKKIWFLALDIWVIFVVTSSLKTWWFLLPRPKAKTSTLQPQIKLLGKQVIHQLQEHHLMAKKKTTFTVHPEFYSKKSSRKIGKTTYRLSSGFVPFFATTALQPPPKKKKTPSAGNLKKKSKEKKLRNSNLHPIVCKKLKAISFSQIFSCFSWGFFGGILGSQPLLPGFSLSKNPLDFHLGGFTPGGGVWERSRALGCC